MALHFAVVISVERQSFERYSVPESVESSWTVGAEPVICSWNEGELVTETEEITDSTNTLVFVQFTRVTLALARSNYVNRRRQHTEGYRVDLALHDDCRVLAAVQVDRLVEVSLIHSQTRLVLLVFLAKWFRKRERYQCHPY